MLLRADVEKWMKDHNKQQLDILMTKEANPRYGILRSGKLVDYTYHVFDRKASYWGYIDWLAPTVDGDKYIGCNADKVSFDGLIREAYIRNNAYMDAKKEAARQKILDQMVEGGLWVK